MHQAGRETEAKPLSQMRAHDRSSSYSFFWDQPIGWDPCETFLFTTQKHLPEGWRSAWEQGKNAVFRVKRVHESMTDVVFCTRPRISRMKDQAKPSWMICHRLFCLFHYLLWVVIQMVNFFLLAPYWFPIYKWPAELLYHDEWKTVLALIVSQIYLALDKCSLSHVAHRTTEHPFTAATL